MLQCHEISWFHIQNFYLCLKQLFTPYLWFVVFSQDFSPLCADFLAQFSDRHKHWTWFPQWGVWSLSKEIIKWRCHSIPPTSSLSRPCCEELLAKKTHPFSIGRLWTGCLRWRQESWGFLESFLRGSLHTWAIYSGIHPAGDQHVLFRLTNCPSGTEAECSFLSLLHACLVWMIYFCLFLNWWHLNLAYRG